MKIKESNDLYTRIGDKCTIAIEQNKKTNPCIMTGSMEALFKGYVTSYLLKIQLKSGEILINVSDCKLLFDIDTYYFDGPSGRVELTFE